MANEINYENNYGFSENWKVSKEHPGYMVKTIVVGNVTANILRPSLTPAERVRREKEVMQSIARALAPSLMREN